MLGRNKFTLLVLSFFFCFNSHATCPGSCIVKNSNMIEVPELLMEALQELGSEQCIKYLTKIRIGEKVENGESDIEVTGSEASLIAIQCDQEK